MERTSSIHECMERLKTACMRLWDEFNDSKSWFNDPITEEQLRKFEQKTKIVLPEEYKEFLRFSNGAQIKQRRGLFYKLEEIRTEYGIPDHYIVIAETVGDGERMVLSELDGQIYLYFNGRIEQCDLHWWLDCTLDQCENLIDSYEIKAERENLRKAGITEEQEEYELWAAILGEKRAKEIMEEKKKRKEGNKK